MLDNLNVKEFSNGEIIPRAKSKSEWFLAAENHEPAWCHSKNIVKGDESLGLLYNWYALTDPRGLAPKGWRIPNKDDYELLISFCGGEEKSIHNFKELKCWQKRLSRRKETGTYTSDNANNVWWSSSAGNTNGYSYGYRVDKFCQFSFPKGVGLPIICIKNSNS